MKPLSELIESAEPEFIDYDENCTSVCDRESYDKMKAIAIELAKACEFRTMPITNDYPTVSGLLETIENDDAAIAEAITKARVMLEK